MKQKKLSKYFSSVSEISNLYYLKFFSKYIKKNSEILDFGCGTGELIEKLDVKKKIGVEKNTHSVSILKKKKILNFKNIKSLKNQKFDVIFALSVLDHIEKPIEIIELLKKRLKKNGKLIIIVRQDSFNQTSYNSKYKEHIYSWSRLSFGNIIKKLKLNVLKEGFIYFTLIPKFNFFSKFLNKDFIIFLSQIYYFLNFKDKRLYFICKN